MKFREWFFKLLFGAEWRSLQAFIKVDAINLERIANYQKLERAMSAEKTDLIVELAKTRAGAAGWRAKFEKATALRSPARFKLEGGMPAEQIAHRLAGQEKAPVIEAIVAHLSIKIVELSDKATDAPRGPETLRDGRVLAAFTESERLHFSGQASGVAEVLANLQEMTAPQAETAEQEANG